MEPPSELLASSSSHAWCAFRRGRVRVRLRVRLRVRVRVRAEVRVTLSRT